MQSNPQHFRASDFAKRITKRASNLRVTSLIRIGQDQLLQFSKSCVFVPVLKSFLLFDNVTDDVVYF